MGREVTAMARKKKAEKKKDYQQVLVVIAIVECLADIVISICEVIALIH